MGSSRRTLEDALQAPLAALQRMAARQAEASPPSLDLWRRDAVNYLLQIDGLIGLALQDGAGQVLAAEPAAIGRQVEAALLSRIGAAAAKPTGEGAATRPRLSPPWRDHGQPFVQLSVHPIVDGELALWAWLSVAGRVDPVLSVLPSNQAVSLWQGGHEVLHRRSSGRTALTVSVELELVDGRWTVRLSRDTSTLSGLPTALALLGIVVVSYLAYAAAILLHRSRRQGVALGEANARLQVLLDQVADAVIAVDAGYRINAFNPAASRLFGYSAEQAVGLPLQQLFEQLPTSAASDAESGSGPTTLLARARDGAALMVECSTVATSVNGEPHHVVTCRDASERERSDRFKREFVSTVTHELRTPLTSISGSLSLLGSGRVQPLNAAAGQLVEVARTNSVRLQKLINDLLDIEKIAAHGMTFDFEVRPLHPLREQAIVANTPYAERFGVEIHLRRAEQEAQVRVDSHRFDQVMANLLSNAAKFSQQSGRVDVECRLSAERVRVAVIDHGRGIPVEFQDRIFQRFSQAAADGGSQPRGGSGLGLAISRDLIEQMEGRMGFETVIGVGTTFWFELPRIAGS